MKNIFRLLVIFCLSGAFAFGYEGETYPEEKFVLHFYADDDNKKDELLYTFQKLDDKNARVRVDIKPTSADPISFDLDTYVNFEITSCGDGCIKIVNFDYGLWSEGSVAYYKYVPKKKSWFLFKDESDVPDIDPEYGMPTGKRDIGYAEYDLSQRIDGKVIPSFSKTPLKTLEKKCKKMTDKFFSSLNKAYIEYYLQHYPLSKKTVTSYNNAAYYMIKKEKFFTAIFLLEKIVEKFPQRTVAYINLGDAYYSDYDKRYKQAYAKYIALMEKHNKRSRIPKRVWKRMDQDISDF